jgi:hypothetical protein
MKMENVSQNQTLTPQYIMAALYELKERQAETDLQIEKTARQVEKTTRQVEKTTLEVEKVTGTLGSWANNQGSFAEEYFFNSFEYGKQNFFGEKFDRVTKNLKGTETDDEYDLLLINGKSIGIVEVKYKAHENDLPKVLRKAETFRVNFPKYAKHQVYIGLASLAFYPELEKKCINQGIAIIKQVGDSVVINDQHLKVF